MVFTLDSRDLRHVISAHSVSSTQPSCPKDPPVLNVARRVKFGTEREIRYGGSKTLRSVLRNAWFSNVVRALLGTGSPDPTLESASPSLLRVDLAWISH